MTVPFLPGRGPTASSVGGVGSERVDSGVVRFRPFGSPSEPFVSFPELGRSIYGATPRWMRRSLYRRTWELSQQLRAGTETPFEYILAVDGYLTSGFGYSERPTAPAPGRAPLDAFLIDTRDGYCQHFAGAMALLLRMGGIPARVATGFSPGGFSKRRDAWIVRDTDAHAWVEAWFDQLGWVTFDPTPDSTPARSQIAALEAPPPSAPVSDSGAPQGATGDVSGGGRGGDLRPDLLFDVQAGGAPGGATSADGGGMAWWAWTLLAALAAAGVGVGGGRRAPAAGARAATPARPRGRGARGRPPPRRPPAADGHHAEAARAQPRRLGRGDRVPARAQRVTLRPRAAGADGCRAPRAAAGAGPGVRADRSIAGVVGAAATASVTPGRGTANCALKGGREEFGSPAPFHRRRTQLATPRAKSRPVST